MDVSSFNYWSTCTLRSRSLKYVKSAKASTDVPTTVSQKSPIRHFSLTFPQVPEFISQRRRWLNGSLFASIHSTIFFYKIWTSGQNPIRMLVLQVLELVLLQHDQATSSMSDRIYLQRRPASLHLDLSCQLLPCLFLCEYPKANNRFESLNSD